MNSKGRDAQWHIDGRSARHGVAALVLGKNPSLTPDQVRAILRATADDLGLDGRELSGGSTSIILPANGHQARFVDELFPNVNTSNFHGTLVVTATTPGGRIAATALQVGSSAGEFTALPVVPLDP